jgi:hypothetical protein
MIENISFDHDYLLTGRRVGLVGECFDITAASMTTRVRSRRKISEDDGATIKRQKNISPSPPRIFHFASRCSRYCCQH